MPRREAVEQEFVERTIPLPDVIVNTTSLLVMIAYLQTSYSLSTASSEVADLLLTLKAGGMAIVRLNDPITIEPYHLTQKKDQIVSPLASRLRDLVIEALQAHVD